MLGKEIGAILLAMVVLFTVGMIWFHLVDGIIEKCKGLFRKKEPWHPLPEKEEKKKKESL